jgi:hypothetical protein
VGGFADNPAVGENRPKMKWAAVGAGIDFELEQGTGQARAFVFDTERSSCSPLRRGCFEKLFFAR